MREEFSACEESKRIRHLANGRTFISLTFIQMTLVEIKLRSGTSLMCSAFYWQVSLERILQSSTTFTLFSNKLSIFDMAQPIITEMRRGIDACLKKFWSNPCSACVITQKLQKLLATWVALLNASAKYNTYNTSPLQR